MKRRQLLKISGGAVALAASQAVAASQSKIFNWKMVMTWPKAFPGLATGMQWFADELKRVTQGRLNITLYGAGELVPAFEVFNAVSEGSAEMGHGPAYYWKGKIPAAEIFTAVPFGMTPLELDAWLYEGGGIELLNECYKPFGVLALPAGNSDFQMGGWFNKEINTVEDLKGLKIRILGIAGEVYRRAGATPISMPGNEIFTSMQSGVIEAADWVGPWNDQAFGLQKVAKYYYGTWQEPGSACELMINEKAFEKLPEDLKQLVHLTARAASLRMLTEFRINNAKALKNIVDKQGVRLKYFPQPVLAEFKKYTEEYMKEYSERDALSKKCYNSYYSFLNEQKIWSDNEIHYLQARDRMGYFL
ncbi:TRAP transporter substrate-binding protein [Suttonella ornithocola]|uniref:Neu5Ac-binding protein n=1 Tax=Suttonella ornithocola TaxID=279832 RepID=A0A380MYA5_9GAMM|nr:TRAP transporter substrate-binding protein [Suttonella ornithocola]SUO97268.1 Neu5Ac-binding protein [Suttonella ornithocola]